MPTDAYQDHVLGAPDVCSNCFRLIRAERLDPTRNGFGGELESHYERVRRTTSVEHPDTGDEPTQAQGVFCMCGVESARHRLWCSDDIGEPEFREFLKHLLRSLARKDVSVPRQETAAYALQAFRDGEGVDAALAQAVEAGIVARAASDERVSAD